MVDNLGFIDFKAMVLVALKAGKPQTGKDGVLWPLLQNLLGEIDALMNADGRNAGSQCKCYGSKQVQSSLGELTYVSPKSDH